MALVSHQEMYKSIEKEVKEEIKLLHESSPKYVYQEESQGAIIQKYNVEVVNIDATYTVNGGKGAQIVEENNILSPEDFSIRYFRRLGVSSDCY